MLTQNRNTLFISLKLFIAFAAVIVFSSFQLDKSLSEVYTEEKKLDADGNEIVTLCSDVFRNYTNRVYRQLSYSEGQDTIDFQVFEKAIKGYTYLKQTDGLMNEEFLTIIDFSKTSIKKRLWTIDIATKEVRFNELVAHGKRTGDAEAKYFSNSHSSHKSSLGFYTTGGLYYGRNNLSLKLNGLEKGFNSNAFARGIVIHGANYVNLSIASGADRIGRSFGCPAVSQQANKPLVNTIKGGSCLFIYHPTANYLEESRIINANIYIPVDELDS